MADDRVKVVLRNRGRGNRAFYNAGGESFELRPGEVSEPVEMVKVVAERFEALSDDGDDLQVLSGAEARKYAKEREQAHFQSAGDAPEDTSGAQREDGTGTLGYTTPSGGGGGKANPPQGLDPEVRKASEEAERKASEAIEEATRKQNEEANKASQEAAEKARKAAEQPKKAK